MIEGFHFHLIRHRLEMAHYFALPILGHATEVLPGGSIRLQNFLESSRKDRRELAGFDVAVEEFRKGYPSPHYSDAVSMTFRWLRQLEKGWRLIIDSLQ